MKRIFLRFPSRNIRKRNLIMIMLIIFILCVLHLQVLKTEKGILQPTLKESVKILRETENVTFGHKVENISNMNSSFTAELKASELSTTPLPLEVIQRMMIKEMLSTKNYQKICGDKEDSSFNINVDDEIFKSNPNVDCSKDSFVMFVVLSYVSNYQYREKVRQSWASIRQINEKKMTFLFFVYSDRQMSGNEKVNLKKEQDDYLDTVIINETHSIRTEAKVFLNVFQFLILGCNKPEFFVFATDSMFVNIPTLLEAIMTHKDISRPSSSSRSLFLCRVKKNTPATRNKKSSWYVSKEEWSDKNYPPYCDLQQGMAISAEILKDLFICSHFARRLWIADVFLTGVLTKMLEVTIENFLEDFSTAQMKNHYIHGDMTHNVFLTDGHGYSDHTWRLIFTRSLREF